MQRGEVCRDRLRLLNPRVTIEAHASPIEEHLDAIKQQKVVVVSESELDTMVCLF